jgi:hypothetical protein
MLETSIITGRIPVSVPGTLSTRSLYVKILTGQFAMRPYRAKKAKVVTGELLIRYSSRQWPSKKLGPIIGNQEILDGISNLLKEVNLHHNKDVSYSVQQREIKDTITITLSAKLAQEILDRGWAHLEL